MTARLLVGDVFDRMAELPYGSVDLVLTSPPFLALRSYLPPDHPDKAKEIGSEATPADFLDVLLELTAEWGRLLAPHGSLCVELGDTYSGSGGAGGDYSLGGLRAGQERFGGSARANRGGRGGRASMVEKATGGHHVGGPGWPLPKSLCGIPTLYAWSLAYGRNLLTGEESPAGMWRVRNLVAWVRPNPPVGALADKFRPATSYLTVATLARDRWFDLDAVRTAPVTDQSRQGDPGRSHSMRGVTEGGERHRNLVSHPAGKPPLDWWEIPPGGYSGAHFAVWPPDLCEQPIEAMCPRRVCRTCGQPSRRVRAVGTSDAGKAVTERSSTWTSCGCPGADGLRLDGFHTGPGWRPGVVLDPFAGSGTTLMVAAGHGRDAIGIDIDARNADLARERVGMFLDVVPSDAQLDDACPDDPDGLHHIGCGCDTSDFLLDPEPEEAP